MAPLGQTNFGYAPDPKTSLDLSKDFSFSKSLQPLLAASHTGDVDLRRFATDSSQRSLPSCVGNSTADSIEILSAIQGYPKVELSRMFVWTLARNLMAEKGYKENTGTYIRLAFQVLHDFGICLESYWPYDESKWDRLPSLMAMSKATGRKIQGYYRIDTSQGSIVEQMLAALRAEHPVVFGTLIDIPWDRYNGKTTLQKPGERSPILGGHAMVCVGYDSKKGFIVKNSWGPNWGDQGYCYLSEDYMNWHNTEDIWVPTIGKDFT